MKKTLTLLLVLLLMLPLFALGAEDTTAPPSTPPAQTKTNPAGLPWGQGQRGRWYQNTQPENPTQPAEPVKPFAPGANFVDENNDGVCDSCGMNQAMARRVQQMQGMRSRMQGRRGNMPGMMGKGRMAIGPVMRNSQQQVPGRFGAQQQEGIFQGPNYVDENKDGVCDHLQDGAKPAPSYRNGGPGRNRR